MDEALQVLTEQFWDLSMSQSPVWASMLGDHRFDEELPDISEEGEALQAEEMARMLERARAVDPSQLVDEDVVTRDVLCAEAENRVLELSTRAHEFTVSAAFGVQTQLLQVPLFVSVTEPEHADALVVRCRRSATFLSDAEDRLRAGVGRGRTPPQVAVEQTVRMIDEYLATDLAADPFLGVAAPERWSSAEAAAWREALEHAVADDLRPALYSYRDVLAHEIAPHARPPERSGVIWLPDGESVYASSVKVHTSLELAGDEVHQIGLDGIAALEDEYRELAGRALGSTDLAQVFARLRDDTSLRFTTREEVRAAAESAVERATAALPAWFGRIPRSGCEVREMAEFEEKDGTIAYYQPPTIDGSRPGIYYINTYAPETRTRFEAEALAFHEALPGHHLQLGVAQELDHLPLFRRNAIANAYVEGWALYTERLADEMGLYSGDTERLGMLSFDSLRAGRLVVDSGLHHAGWSRQRAIDYLRDNSPQPHNVIDNEIDRYIAWPGQALGYKIGQREILRLRAKAEERLGDAFDIRAFHDVVLGSGPLPLTTLAAMVTGWLARYGRGV